MSASVELARRQWEEGHHTLEAHADRRRLLEEMDAVLEELRRRVGGTFTLEELAAAYGDADGWLHETIARREAAPGWPRRVVIAGDAAFHVYSRGAQDYRP